MGITHFPDGMRRPKTATCIICQQIKPINEMSAGLSDKYANQAFACESHIQENSRLFVRGWTDFAINQQPQPAVQSKEVLHG
ncbi:MAG TPA: hypothetical protein VFI74_05685 [Candidatus Saccharimonadales bacterium]|nr:hypothetical protein [Candidatus Saccharimonadales bacterium]